MRKYMLLLAAPLALSGLTVPAQASEGGGEPFITAAHYKKNISLEQFRVNPRSYFKSEEAFRLILRYVGDETGKPDLTAAEFNALIRDETQTRVRNLNTGENINTGAYSAGQFHWFVRSGRSGEQIVQMLVNGVWIDQFSLNCLNAVEDQTPALPPALTTYKPPVLTPIGPPKVTTTMAPSQEGSLTAPYLLGTPGVTYGGGRSTINVGSKSSSSGTSSSSSNSGNGGCTAACTPANPNHRP